MEVSLEPVWDSKLGLWFPSVERRPQKSYDAIQKYIEDTDFLLSLIKPKVRKTMTCIQAGGHIGLWPIKLARHFKEVMTFEPDPPTFAALRRNVASIPSIHAYPEALGEGSGYKVLSHYSERTAVAAMAESYDNGDLHTEVKVVSIDEMEDLWESRIGAIILDTEGYEPWILRGARRTIKAERPLIMCEMLARSRDAIYAELEALEYKPVANTVNRKCRDMVFSYAGS